MSKMTTVSAKAAISASHKAFTRTLIYDGLKVECSTLEDGFEKLLALKELWDDYNPYDD